jgi:hypothetical protein
MPRFIRRYVEPVGIHDLRPCLYEVADKLFISALLGIDLAYSAEFGVRSKDQVGARRPPRLVPAGTVGRDLLLVTRTIDRLPHVGHIEQV